MPAQVSEASAAAAAVPPPPTLNVIADKGRKRGSGRGRPTSIGSLGESFANLNRWSQSTVSSRASALPTNAHSQQHTRSSLVKRLSGGFMPSSIYGHTPSASMSGNHAESSSNTNSLALPTPGSGFDTTSLPPSPSRYPAPPPNGRPPPLPSPRKIQAHDRSESANIPARNGGDYFGDTWSHGRRPSQSNGMIRARISTTEGDVKPSSSKGGAGSSPRNSRSRINDRRGSSDANGAPPVRRYSGQAGSQRPRSARHGRNNSEAQGAASTSGTQDASASRERERNRRRKTPSQKAMLSKALQKAHHAVVLDNAQNYEGAMDAYGDACDLLQQVMARSCGDDDQRKLDAIRNTYRNRIQELQANELATSKSRDKALPEVPDGPGEVTDPEPFSPLTEDEGISGNGISQPSDANHATDTHLVGSSRRHQRDSSEASAVALPPEQVPPRRQSLKPHKMRPDPPTIHTPLDVRMPANDFVSHAPVRADTKHIPPSLSLPPPPSPDYLPRPLSPRPLSPRPLSPQPLSPRPLSLRPVSPGPLSPLPPSPRPLSQGLHVPSAANEPPFSPTIPETSLINQVASTVAVLPANAESTSWLDTIDESGSSSSSSVHSRTSSTGLRRKHIRHDSGATEAEFDAALDAAVEAAYDDGYEPAHDANGHGRMGAAVSTEDDEADLRVSAARRNVDRAKQRVREAEREAALVTARAQHQTPLDLSFSGANASQTELMYEDDEAAEEERMLEEMTRDFAFDDSGYDGLSKSALPRQSDSSSFSGRTWGSSVGSSAATAGTPLSSVAEAPAIPTLPGNTIKKIPPVPSAIVPGTMAGAEYAARPQDGNPRGAAAAAANTAGLPTMGVRERRLSKRQSRQLKIETGRRAPSPGAPGQNSLDPGRSRVSASASDSTLLSALPTSAQETGSTGQPQLPSPTAASSTMSLDTAVIPGPNRLQKHRDHSGLPSPARSTSKGPHPHVLRKNFSSSSLRSSRPTTSGAEEMPGTPLNRSFSSSHTLIRDGLHPEIPDVPSPFAQDPGRYNLPAPDVSFLESELHSLPGGGAEGAPSSDGPAALEPCPESFLLRPFWLMRAMYQIIAHPRGGYLTNRLFVPRDAWRVKNVKLKNIDDKVASCDLLTAALLNLSKVDTLDADAVLEEMQAFELLLDQVQGQLGKKLGAEVGIHGSMNIFRSPNPDDGAALTDTSTGARSVSAGSRSYLPSWRRLRSRNATGPVVTSSAAAAAARDPHRDPLTIRTLPMTSSISTRLPKRDVSVITGVGPFAHYMTALGRLCDAVQVLDQIARQVEDPGLKHSSQTHVGLELCARHAAEFFAFFVCRFAVADIGLMLDKFTKRGSEWVLA